MNPRDAPMRINLAILKKREKQRFIHRDTGWEEMVPLEISVEMFSTGSFNASWEVDFL
jgi:hypothetical protein